MKQFIKMGLFLVSTVLLTGCAKEEVQNDIMETYSYVQDENSYILENENIKFTLDPKTTYFEVTDKVNDTIWYSNPKDAENDELANAQSKKYLQSTFLVEYSTLTGINTIFNNYEYSIEKQIYTIETGADYIKVNYSLGDVEKVHVLPNAISESRMNVFMANMDAKQIKQINSYYRKYDINNLRATDNKSELLEKYPDLKDECIYVIRDGVQEYLLVKIEEIFKESGYAFEDYELDNATYSNSNNKEKPFFNISILYRIEDNDLVVELPFDEMKWRDIYPLTKLKVLPYFGAGSKEDEGYILVPESNGGIIKFNNGKVAQNAYYTEIYGWDSAIKRDAVIDESRASFPVFGIANEGKSMLCILEDKASAAAIEADISGRNHSYNYVNATYTTLHSASVDMSAKTDKSVIVFEAEKPKGAIKQRYRFLGTDSYSQMAESYREYLMGKYPILQKNEDTSTPVNVTMLGAVDQVKQRFGFPVSMPVPLTTYKEAYDMLSDLNETGYKNLYIKYSGWMNGGIKQSSLETIKTISQLGSKNDLKNYIKYANELKVPIYLEGMAQYSIETGLFDGFEVNSDAAKYPSREVVKLYNFSPVFYGLEDWKDSYFLLKPQLAVKYMQNITDITNEYEAHGVAFSDVGYLINSDYNPKNLTSRQEVIAMQQEKLGDIATTGTGIVVRNGNDYVIPYVDFITDMDINGGEYYIIDDMVPFYSMVIHGLVNYSGPSINLADDYQELILKSAESGAGLSFTFMKEPTSALHNSNYTYYFGVDYDIWKDEASAIYRRYEEELGHCYNQYITEHELLERGVSVTSYEDGTEVYVNYNEVDYITGDITVPAQDYIVKRR